jgi:hypothetical protein
VASHGVWCSLECCVHRSIRRIGLPVPTLSRSFQRLDGFSPVPSPVPLRVRVHPLMRFASPSEYVLLVTCPTPKLGRAPSLGSLSPSRHERLKSTCRRAFPRPTTFRPQRFSRSRRVPPSRTVAGLFHPTATSGIRSSGVFPAARPARLIGESCPHAVTELLLTASRPAAASSTRSAFRALIRAAIRCGRQAV